MRHITLIAALFGVLALGLGLGLSPRTLDAAADEKSTPPVEERKGQAPPADLANQVAVLEKQIAELRQQRKSAARGAIHAGKRADLTRKSVRASCGSYKDYQDDLDALRAFHNRLEMTTTEIRAHQDTFAKIHGGAPAGYLELTVRGEPKHIFVLKIRDLAGADLGTVTVNEWSEPMLTRVLVRTQAAPNVPKELCMVAQPTRFDDGVLKALKACNAAGYKTVTFTGYVYSGEDSSKPNENSDPPGFKWYDEEAKTTADLIEEIEPTPKRFWAFSF